MLAVGISFLVALVMAIPAVKLRRLTSLDAGALIFFPVMAIIGLIFAPETTVKYAPVIGTAALALSVGIGIWMGRPFTLVYAKAQAPQEVWDNPYFIAGCRKLSVAWFYAFLVMTISALVGTFFAPTSAAALILDWGVPIVVIVITVRWQLRAVHRMQSAGRERAQQAASEQQP